MGPSGYTGYNRRSTPSPRGQQTGSPSSTIVRRGSAGSPRSSPQENNEAINLDWFPIENYALAPHLGGSPRGSSEASERSNSLTLDSDCEAARAIDAEIALIFEQSDPDPTSPNLSPETNHATAPILPQAAETSLAGMEEPISQDNNITTDLPSDWDTKFKVVGHDTDYLRLSSINNFKKKELLPEFRQNLKKILNTISDDGIEILFQEIVKKSCKTSAIPESQMHRQLAVVPTSAGPKFPVVLDSQGNPDYILDGRFIKCDHQRHSKLFPAMLFNPEAMTFSLDMQKLIITSILDSRYNYHREFKRALETVNEVIEAADELPTVYSYNTTKPEKREAKLLKKIDDIPENITEKLINSFLKSNQRQYFYINPFDESGKEFIILGTRQHKDNAKYTKSLIRAEPIQNNNLIGAIKPCHLFYYDEQSSKPYLMNAAGNREYCSSWPPENTSVADAFQALSSEGKVEFIIQTTRYFTHYHTDHKHHTDQRIVHELNEFLGSEEEPKPQPLKERMAEFLPAGPYERQKKRQKQGG